MFPESNDLSAAVTVCAIVSEFLNVTVCPGWIVIVAGAYAKFFVSTTADALADALADGGAVWAVPASGTKVYAAPAATATSRTVGTVFMMLS